MSVLQSGRQGGKSALRPVHLLGSLLLALTFSPPARATTYVTVDDHPNPVTLVEGETVMIRFDVSQAGNGGNFYLARDLAGTGKYDPLAAAAIPGNAFTDGGSGDLDPAPGKVALRIYVDPRFPAGPYVIHIQDVSDHTTLDLPGDVTIAPKPEAQAIAGRVAVVSDTNPAGNLPPDAVIWAYPNPGTGDPNIPVASAHIRPDGSYTLPVPPGTYLLFAEWLGNLSSQRQVVSVTAGQTQSGLNLALLQGQEVNGMVQAGGQRMADALVQAVSASATTVSTRTFADGTYTLVLASGQYKISAAGGTEQVTVADGPVDGVDFPAPAPPPTPAVGTILTVAGNGILGFGGDGRPALTARLLSPGGIAIDAAGDLYMADNRVNRIRKVEAATGRIVTVAGSSPWDSIRGLTPGLGAGGSSGDGGLATRALLNTPQHVGVDAAGNLYIGDLNNHRIRKVDAVTGIITTVAGNGKEGFSGDGGPATAAQLAGPQSVVLDRAGNLYIADNRNRRVRKVDANGIMTTVAGGGTEALKDGAVATAVALGFPRELALDAAGNLYIGDGQLNRILKLTPAGLLRFVAGDGTAGFSGDGGPATAAQFNVGFPHMAVDSAGNLFFQDGINHRIRKVSPDGTISTVAGSGPYGPGVPGSFAGDGGPATAARLWAGGGVAIDAAGSLLFADQGNHRIRKVIGIAAPGLVAGQ